MAYFADGCSQDVRVERFTTAGRQLVRTFPDAGQDFVRLAGRYLAVDTGGGVVVYDTRTGLVAYRLTVQLNVKSLDIQEDGKTRSCTGCLPELAISGS